MNCLRAKSRECRLHLYELLAKAASQGFANPHLLHQQSVCRGWDAPELEDLEDSGTNLYLLDLKPEQFEFGQPLHGFVLKLLNRRSLCRTATGRSGTCIAETDSREARRTGRAWKGSDRLRDQVQTAYTAYRYGLRSCEPRFPMLRPASHGSLAAR